MSVHRFDSYRRTSKVLLLFINRIFQSYFLKNLRNCLKMKDLMKKRHFQRATLRRLVHFTPETAEQIKNALEVVDKAVESVQCAKIKKKFDDLRKQFIGMH